MNRSTLGSPRALLRWFCAIAVTLVVLAGCATKGGTDGQGVGSQLDAAAPGLNRCEQKGSALCATASKAAESLLLLSTTKQITVGDICPWQKDGQGIGSQIDAKAPLKPQLDRGVAVLDEVLLRTQCVQACGGGPECCTCCAQPTSNPAGLAAQCGGSSRLR